MRGYGSIPVVYVAMDPLTALDCPLEEQQTGKRPMEDLQLLNSSSAHLSTPLVWPAPKE